MPIATLSLPSRKDLSPRRAVALLILALLYLAGIWFLYHFVPLFRAPLHEGGRNVGGDWRFCFYPAIRALWQGRDPYLLAVYNPPWAFLLLSPFAILPPDLGAVTISMTGIYVFAYVARRLGASWSIAALFALCPATLHGSLYGNIDWLVVLGFLLPPQFGLFLVLLKPQLGFAVIFLWLIKSWRHGGWRSALRTFAPATMALATSMIIALAIGSPWPFSMSKLPSAWWNINLWPYGIPLGLVLLAAAIYQEDRRCAISASPFLTPYVTPSTLALFPLGMFPGRLKSLVALAILWFIIPFPALLITAFQTMLDSLMRIV